MRKPERTCKLAHLGTNLIVLLMSMKASVTRRGAIQLGKNVACDAFDETRPLRVVTHAHADHMIGLPQSLHTCEKVLMTSATKDLIDVMRGSYLLTSGLVETLNYSRTLQYKEDRVTFFKADHILGSAQVLVEDAEGNRIVFTGDFRINETPVLDADVLVMEATYGSPSCKRSFGVNIKNLLVSLTQKGLKEGPVYVFGYHGKLQEVMETLYMAGVKVPFLVSEKIFRVSKACERHGIRIGHLLLSDELEARELVRKRSPCVIFCHMNLRHKTESTNFRICVTGWEFDSPVRQTAEKEYIVALSDHSDFDGLMEYVRRSKPQLVITDGFRGGHAETLSREIRRRLGIYSVALPKR